MKQLANIFKLMPTAKPVRSGQGYLALNEFVFPTITFGIENVLSFTAGISILFGSENQLIHLIILSILLSITGQIGDISASLIKRFSDVKNSSDIIPGHGGMLDKIDSSLFNASILFFYLQFFIM